LEVLLDSSYAAIHALWQSLAVALVGQTFFDSHYGIKLRPPFLRMIANSAERLPLKSRRYSFRVFGSGQSYGCCCRLFPDIYSASRAHPTMQSQLPS
jgi:hypothetical protein